MTDFESHKYRVEIEVPRVARPQMTTWRTLAVRDTYSDVGDLADYLIESLSMSGIPLAMARDWAAKSLRVKPVTTVITNGDPEPMPQWRPKVSHPRT